jgi:glycosyltransferase involved in cell wall biosynthesis
MVSIITPTCQRPAELRRAITSIQAQSFQDFEHIIVSDGYDEDVDLYHYPPRWRVAQLGRRRWDQGATPRNLGLLLARGDLIAYLDDDNEWMPDHLASLIEAICQADFAFSDMLIEGEGRTIGTGRPEVTHIDTSCLLHRRDLATQWTHERYENDWAVVESWLAMGATWHASNRVTARYHQRPAA